MALSCIMILFIVITTVKFHSKEINLEDALNMHEDKMSRLANKICCSKPRIDLNSKSHYVFYLCLDKETVNKIKGYLDELLELSSIKNPYYEFFLKDNFYVNLSVGDVRSLITQEHENCLIILFSMFLFDMKTPDEVAVLYLILQKLISHRINELTRIAYSIGIISIKIRNILNNVKSCIHIEKRIFKSLLLKIRFNFKRNTKIVFSRLKNTKTNNEKYIKRILKVIKTVEEHITMTKTITTPIGIIYESITNLSNLKEPKTSNNISVNINLEYTSKNILENREKFMKDILVDDLYSKYKAMSYETLQKYTYIAFNNNYKSIKNQILKLEENNSKDLKTANTEYYKTMNYVATDFILEMQYIVKGITYQSQSVGILMNICNGLQRIDDILIEWKREIKNEIE